MNFPKETGSYTNIDESHRQHGEPKHTLTLIGCAIIIRCFENPNALFMLEALEGDTLSIIHLSNTNRIICLLQNHINIVYLFSSSNSSR